jgi:hypothetical protein
LREDLKGLPWGWVAVKHSRKETIAGLGGKPTGVKPSSPILLDATGRRPTNAGSVLPVFREFDGYRLKDWSPLGLGYLP